MFPYCFMDISPISTRSSRFFLRKRSRKDAPTVGYENLWRIELDGQLSAEILDVKLIVHMSDAGARLTSYSPSGAQGWRSEWPATSIRIALT